MRHWGSKEWMGNSSWSTAKLLRSLRLHKTLLWFIKRGYQKP